MITHGDVAAARHLIGRPPKEYSKLLRTTMAFVWDNYGLAGDELNPWSRRHCERTGQEFSFHATLSPSIELINDATNQRLRTVLEPSEHWMLEIPRLLNPASSTTSLAVTDDGGAAILLPPAAYGMLFRWSELVFGIELWLEKEGLVYAPLDRELFRSVGYMFSGVGGSQVDMEELTTLLLMLDSWRSTNDGRTYRQQVWEAVIFQQMVMILHEFGHVDLINRGFDGSRRSSIPVVRNFQMFSDEMAVDDWSGPRIARVADSLMGYLKGGRKYASDALWYFYTLQDIVNDYLDQPRAKWELCVRFLYLLKDLGVIGEYEYFSEVFDSLVGQAGGSTRRQLVDAHEQSIRGAMRNELIRRRLFGFWPRYSGSLSIPEVFSGARETLGLT